MQGKRRVDSIKIVQNSAINSFNLIMKSSISNKRRLKSKILDVKSIPFEFRGHAFNRN